MCALILGLQQAQHPPAWLRRSAPPQPAGEAPPGEHAASSGSHSSCTFQPAGRAGSPELRLKGQCRELLHVLGERLQQRWPRSFKQALHSNEGAIVCCFHEAAAATEGNVGAYMLRLVREAAPVVEGIRWVGRPCGWRCCSPCLAARHALATCRGSHIRYAEATALHAAVMQAC